MRIAFLTPGTGNYHCGVCMRDNSLARHLIDHGHEVIMLPTYLPHLLDEEAAGTKKSPVFLGGINVYLQHKFPIFRKSPKWLDNLFNSERLLRWVAGKRGMTTPRELSEITLSTLQGKDGPLVKEVEKVIDWFKQFGKPDILILSTILLAGIGRVVRKELNIPVIGFLQGEDGFLDSLLPEYREEAWSLLGSDARKLDACVSPSHYFAGHMGSRLGIPKNKIQYFPNGISLEGYDVANSKPDQPTIGYFARICPEKGLDLLIDAYIELKKSDQHESLRLAIAGTLPSENITYLEEQKTKISRAGLDDFVEISTNLSRPEKINFLKELTLFCVPARFPEAFGLYVIEAMASGVPVVVPDHGSFPEIIEETKGGLLYAKNDPGGLTHALSTMLGDSKQAQQFGEQGREAVHPKYSNDKLARELVENILAPLVATK
ncbi:MAG: glycosyltransferase family 4 protein [Opitutae bacterium]